MINIIVNHFVALWDTIDGNTEKQGNTEIASAM